MISHAAQCGPCILVTLGLGAIGGLLMGLGSLKEKSGTCKTGLILAGAIFIFVGFMSEAYRGIERCYSDDTRAVYMFWSFAIAAPILMLLAFLYSKRQVVCALASRVIAGSQNFFARRWLRRK